MKCQGNCVESFAIPAAIIVFSSPGLLESDTAIQFGRRISFTYFEMQPPGTASSGRSRDFPQQVPSNAMAAICRPYGDQQQFGLIDDHARKGKADRPIVAPVENDPAIGIAEHPVALRA